MTFDPEQNRTLTGLLTADERAALEAEKHFYDAAQPFYPLGFSVSYRNEGHWDVFAFRCPGKASAWKHAHPDGQTTERDDCRERAFRIRGEAGNVWVADERWNPHRKNTEQPPMFKSVIGAMLWIMEELMQEPKHKNAQTEETE